jgi:hypothetical protein
MLPVLSCAAYARSDREIRATRPNRVDQGPHALCVVGAIAIHENDDIGIRGRLRCEQASPTITRSDRKNLRTRSRRTRRSVVAASTVRDDDTLDNIARDGTHR